MELHKQADEVTTKLVKGMDHGRRKILKVGGTKDMIVREAHAKIFKPHPLQVKPCPFLNDRRYCD